MLVGTGICSDMALNGLTSNILGSLSVVIERGKKLIPFNAVYNTPGMI